MPTVREFARLTTDPTPGSLDLATIPPSAFRWLVEHAHGRGSSTLISLEGSRAVRVLNYVGVLETPCGTQIEILPKCMETEESVDNGRRLLVNMIMEGLQLKPRQGGLSDIVTFKLPLPEWLASRFLHEASDLVRRGLRQSYQRVQNKEPFLRGSLNVSRQIRSGPASAHLHNVRYDELSFNRPENRLIRSTIEVVMRSTRLSDNWKRARDLSTMMGNIDESANISADLRQWSDDRLTADYVDIKSLCELILLRRTPFAVAGGQRGLSMLFPMERLFELYVTNSLRKMVPTCLQIKTQVGDQHLCEHSGEGWFRLRPDIIVSNGVQKWIVDAKWKILSQDRARQYDLSQSDFYQMFAYGERYLEGNGDLFLVFPRTTQFSEPLPPFHFSNQMRLHVVPFDLTRREAPYAFIERL